MSLQDIPTKQEKKIPDLVPQEAKNNATSCQDKKKLAVRLLTFIPGKTLYSVRPWTTEHFYQCGRLIAQFMVALKVVLMINYPPKQLSFIFICNLLMKKSFFYKHQDFKNDALSARRFIWQLSSVPNVRGFLSAVKDDLDRQMCLEVIDAFENEAMAIADQLEKV